MTRERGSKPTGFPAATAGPRSSVIFAAAMKNMTSIERVRMSAAKNIVVIAHDSKKKDLMEWVKFNRLVLERHRLFATGTTGALVEQFTNLSVTRFRSGPLGGDQQVGAKIAEGELDVLIFFWDPLEPQPHDPDVKALLRIAVLCNIPTACNRATADFLMTSPLFHGEYDRLVDNHALSHPVAQSRPI
jgi:methylglyoxal synthase